MSHSISPEDPNSRWMNWKPDIQIFTDVAKYEPTKPSKPGSDGFVGPYSGHFQKIEASEDSTGEGSVGFVGATFENPAAVARASAVLAAAGVINLELNGVRVAGVWSDLDGPGIRAALLAIGACDLPVTYLDGSSIPDRFKSRRVAGEAVPLAILVEMECSPEPWIVRDQLSTEIGWRKGARRG
jgi:hypothetical protein